jgi:hypothetical protein
METSGHAGTAAGRIPPTESRRATRVRRVTRWQAVADVQELKTDDERPRSVAVIHNWIRGFSN